ncbi:MAG: sigma factor, partial [Dehalococcoidia bacterium]
MTDRDEIEPPDEGLQSSLAELSDEVLLTRIGSRDRESFEALYRRYADLVYSIALRVLADPQLAQDISQEVFLRLWRHPGAFDVERG